MWNMASMFFQNGCRFQPIFTIFQPIEAIQFWFWWLYPGLLGSRNPVGIIICIKNVIEHRWRPFFHKLAAIPTHFHHISAYSGHTVVIWMAIPMIWGQGIHWNQYLYIKYNRARVTASLYFKITANPSHSWPQGYFSSRCSQSYGIDGYMPSF